MPKGYIVGRISVHDLEAYKRYVAKASEAIKTYKGTFLVRGGAFEILDGEARSRNVVIEFESVEAAKAYYHSPEYTEARLLRCQASVGDFVVVEGI